MFAVKISHFIGPHVIFALVISKCISRAMALLYSMLRNGHLAFCLESFMVISSLCVFARCLARLSGLLLCFPHCSIWHCHISICPGMCCMNPSFPHMFC